ncbi:hypothetical protein [Rothia sp. P7208]|uniref:hypothetical protein n=1 Tax=Rothia sp. P7208 TaxID=3402660 RepID=UPI003AC4308F
MTERKPENILTKLDFLFDYSRERIFLFVEGKEDVEILRNHELEGMEVIAANGKQEILKMIQDKEQIHYDRPFGFLMDSDYDFICDKDLPFSSNNIFYSKGHDIFMDILRIYSKKFDDSLACRLDEDSNLKNHQDKMNKAAEYREKAVTDAAHLAVIRIACKNKLPQSDKETYSKCFYQIETPLTLESLLRHLKLHDSGSCHEDKLLEILENNDHYSIVGDHDFMHALGSSLIIKALGPSLKKGAKLKDLKDSFIEKIDKDMLDKMDWFSQIKAWARGYSHH